MTDLFRPPFVQVALEHLGYSRRERLCFWLRGRWPRSVVRRRLWARELDDRIAPLLWVNR